MKFSLLINMKMPTIVGIFIFISRLLAFSYLLAETISCSALFSKKEFAVVSNWSILAGQSHELSMKKSHIISVPGVGLRCPYMHVSIIIDIFSNFLEHIFFVLSSKGKL